MTVAPSPTAEATRLIDPRRTSPAAKTPRRLDAVVAAGSAPASRPVRMNPHSSRFTDGGSHSVRGCGSNQYEQPGAFEALLIAFGRVADGNAFEVLVSECGGNFTVVANRDIGRGL